MSLSDPRWSVYAQGGDYHDVVKRALKAVARAADFLAETYREFPSANMRTVALRFLTRATRELHRAGHTATARQLFERLLALLPAAARPPSFEDVIKGSENDHAPF